MPVSQRKWSDYYIWHGPLSTLPGGPFGQSANRLGKSFALDAIRAQPLDYLRTVSASLWADFLPPPSSGSQDTVVRNRAQQQLEYQFPSGPAGQGSPRLDRTTRRARVYARRVAGVYASYDPAGPAMHVVSPYAGWIRAYQRYIIVPGPLLGAIVLAGVAGLAVAWRRFGGPALLPGLVGLCLLLTPAAVAESYPRYLVADVPLLCVFAAIGIQQIAVAVRRQSRS